ncbi:MAG: hypothetical protein IT368_05275 [Candidatus Hydrogenedentes bacterium]|nr:hypothetical protein [Candidatus Hydrogenedentota bacterium]
MLPPLARFGIALGLTFIAAALALPPAVASDIGRDYSDWQTPTPLPPALATATDSGTAVTWKVSEPVLVPGTDGGFDSIAVKDPSIVHEAGAWHVFYTARGPLGYSLGYVQAKSLAALSTAKRTPLRNLGTGPDAYAAAPQVFYFAPQGTWYLVYQTTSAHYQPAYSTNTDIQNPLGWTAPRSLVEKTEAAKWIDFWVIGDDNRMYLFYTRNHERVWMMSTAIESFPAGFSAPCEVFGPVHEAVHVYRVQGRAAWHMLYELRASDGTRRFGLAEAPALAGPWRGITEAYATPAQLVWRPASAPWTEEVSHGEFIRTGNDQTIPYNEDRPKLLIQGLRKDQRVSDYAQLPWRLGLLQR